MNKTVELVNQWGAFEQHHPGGTIEDFCRYQLIKKRTVHTGQPVGGVPPNHIDGLLLKMLGRITKLSLSYASKALAGTGINQIEEFAMLVTVARKNNPKKSEVIYSNLHELSSGTDMLNRLKDKGFIVELPNPDDKRSKILKLTATGFQLIDTCKAKIDRMAKMVLIDMDENDKNLCVTLFKNTEIKLSEKWPQHKDKPFEDIFTELVIERANK